jgi:hypothetical protein
MRGNQDEQEEVFSYIPLEKRVPQDHPLRRVREMTDRALQVVGGVRCVVCADGPAVDSAGAVAAGADFAGAVHHPQ